MNGEIYSAGLAAMKAGKETKDNPYSYSRELKSFCEWIGGFNDAKRGCEAGDMNATDQLKVHEGLRLKPYKCTANRLSIGFGRCLDTKGITELEANFMLAQDVAFYTDELSKKISYFENLNEARQAVLINMAFNLGVSGLLKFKKTLTYIEQQYYEQAAVEMLDSKWATQLPSRSKELSEQMHTGYFKDS